MTKGKQYSIEPLKEDHGFGNGWDDATDGDAESFAVFELGDDPDGSADELVADFKTRAEAEAWIKSQ